MDLDSRSPTKRLHRRKSVYEKVMESDIELCQRVFRNFDKRAKGYINFYDLKPALLQVGIEFPYSQCYHKMISELKDQTGNITFFDFTKIVVNHRKEQEGVEDILDAFVAMGGDEDGGGNVDAEKLIDIIRNDFNLTIDIEGMIKDIDTDKSGEIELVEFQSLLESEVQNPEIVNFKEWFTF